MKSVRMFAVAVVAVVAACGDDGGSNVVVGGGADAVVAECLAPAALGSPTPTAQEGHYILDDTDNNPATPDEPAEYYVFADANADASPDLVLVDLFLGYGAFTDGFATKTVSITGDEADYWACGACVQVQTDYTADGQTGTPYQAVGGTLNITALSTTMIAGTLTNVTFKHVDIDVDAQTSAPSADGCTTSVANMSFSAVPDNATFTGTKPSHKSRWKARLTRN